MPETANFTAYGGRRAITACSVPCLLVFVVLTAVALPAFSEPISRHVKIVIQRLPDEAEKCGLTEPSIRDRVASVLANSKWTVDSSAAADYVYVNTNLFFTLVDTHFVYNVSVELRRGLHADDGRRLIASTIERSRLGIFRRSKSSTIILEDIEELLKKVIGNAEAEGL